MKIGFFDSGIGGITVLHETLKLLPDEDYIYYADTKNVPYGVKDRETVKSCIMDSVNFIAGLGVKALVVACNTATSIAIDDLRKKYDFPVIGMEPAVKPAIENNDNKRVLVLATPLTLREDKFKNLVLRLDGDNIVDMLPFPELVELAEKFELSENTVLPVLKEKLSGYDMNRYGTVVLGCTHFPYFKCMLRRILPKNISIVDGGTGTARNLKRTLEVRGNSNEGCGDIIFYESGNRVDGDSRLHKYLEVIDKVSRSDC